MALPSPLSELRQMEIRKALQFHSQLLPIRNSEPMVVEEVCGLFAVSEEQHAHHAVQGKDRGSLCAHSVCDVECPESIPADLKEANHCSLRG